MAINQETRDKKIKLMDYFYSKTQDNDLWLGFKPQYGWVIYDRKLPNKSAHGEVYWIKCSDWTFFKDKGLIGIIPNIHLSSLI